MTEPSDFQHESGWKEVLRICGFLVAGAVAIATILGLAHWFAAPQLGESNKNAVLAEISTTAPNCTPEFPLEISLTNVSEIDVLSVGFMIQVSEAGHSTKYHSFVGTDRIIPSQHVYRDCFAIPPFKIGEGNPALAEGIPHSLASPQYEITVSGARLRGEE